MPRFCTRCGLSEEMHARVWREPYHIIDACPLPPGFATRDRPKANDLQVAGDHYKGKGIQPWDYIVANDLGFLEGSIIKYVTRYKQKNGVIDLQKAAHFLAKLIEVVTEREAKKP